MKTAFDLEMERVESECERIAREEAKFIGILLLVALVVAVVAVWFA